MNFVQYGTVNQSAFAFAGGGSAGAVNVGTLIQYQIIVINIYNPPPAEEQPVWGRHPRGVSYIH
ncbi:MAG: hypothetical protein NVSMB22_23400 [Chloroflexota bacterium]